MNPVPAPHAIPNLSHGYDGAGNMTSDGVSGYLYDPEGRICAVPNTPMAGSTMITGYLYDVT